MDMGDFYTNERMMQLHVKEERSQAKARGMHRTESLSRSWLPRQGCWILCQMGRMLVMLGRRLEQYGLPQSVVLES
jgi:hypothetical protein